MRKKNYFDESIAQVYDSRWSNLFDPAVVDPTVDFLAELAGSGSALELGIGTGRIALPLKARGVRVSGIDLSAEMVAQMRTKPRAEEIDVVIGDFANAVVDGTFDLVYLLRNTIMNLTTQEAQVECFQNVSRHLSAGGHFVIEVTIPDLRRVPPGETIHPFDVTPNHVGFEEYDFASQIAWSHHYWIGDDDVETFSAPFRYVWPSELDLMARIAGMTLHERWSDWHRNPFDGESRSHVSVWKKSGA